MVRIHFPPAESHTKSMHERLAREVRASSASPPAPPKSVALVWGVLCGERESSIFNSRHPGSVIGIVALSGGTPKFRVLQQVEPADDLCVTPFLSSPPGVASCHRGGEAGHRGHAGGDHPGRKWMACSATSGGRSGSEGVDFGCSSSIFCKS
jgi:hypothetical protein